MPKSENFSVFNSTKLSFSRLLTCAKVKKAGTKSADIKRKKSFVAAIILAGKKGIFSIILFRLISDNKITMSSLNVYV